MIKRLAVLALVVSVLAGCSKPDPVETEAASLYQKAFDLEHSGTAGGRKEAHYIYVKLSMNYPQSSVTDKARARLTELSPRVAADRSAEDAAAATARQQSQDVADAIRERR